VLDPAAYSKSLKYEGASQVFKDHVMAHVPLQLNVPVSEILEFIVTPHCVWLPPSELHAGPVHPPQTTPLGSTPVNTTALPARYVAEQVAPQLILPSLLVIVPTPHPLFVTVRV